MQLHHRWLVLPFMILDALATQAATPNVNLQQSLNDTEIDASWIYNDLGAGFAEAKKTGKPLLVVFR